MQGHGNIYTGNIWCALHPRYFNISIRRRGGRVFAKCDPEKGLYCHFVSISAHVSLTNDDTCIS